MADAPTFFLSHARQDRDMPGNFLRKFYVDLEKVVAQWAGVDLKTEKLLTVDERAEQGQDWDEYLSRGLSNDNAFVAVITPLYFERPNCGKELGVFLLRSTGLGIDSSGGLMGAKNVILIRWLPEEAYAANTSVDSRIPPILRRIEDAPTDDGSDTSRTRSIERYRRKGMQDCVKKEPHYTRLLQLFAARIRSMTGLPPGTGVDFVTAIDAFKYDWSGRFQSRGAPVQPVSIAASPAPRVFPRPLASVVVFYVTRRTFAPDPVAVDFADCLIAEGQHDTSGPVDDVLDALLADVGAAGIAEGFTVFHAAANPVVPANPQPLLDRLSSLSDKRIMAALIVEPNVWPGVGSERGVTAVENVVRSDRWAGLVLLPTVNGRTINVDQLIATRSLPPRIVALPEARALRVTALRHAFIDSRGHLLRTGTVATPQAERVPVLTGLRPKET